ncbi:MAG: hypothetical protein M3Q55_04875 [Acidobacteriota bacterium]|nr:hypothetical protein [Acidobacteriota bacterium]
MARHAQPREVAALKGAAKVHPERYRKEPPKSAHDLGDAPAHLSAAAQAVWFELAEYSPRGVMTGGDRMLMETLCVLVAEFRSAPNDFAAAKIGHMIGCLARMGLTPADRQKLGTEKVKEDDPFAGF